MGLFTKALGLFDGKAHLCQRMSVQRSINRGIQIAAFFNALDTGDHTGDPSSPLIHSLLPPK